jgi:ParB-like chromosome segregation protein Spo0J
MQSDTLVHIEPTPSEGWMREPQAEAYLTEINVAWSYVRRVPVGLIDVGRSLRNNARIGLAVDQDYVTQYADAMRRGDTIPTMVAFMERDGTYTLAGGNHRLPAAISAGRTHVDLYVVHCNDQAVRDMIPANLNRWHGRAVAASERVEQALAWQQKYGRTTRQASLFFGIPEKTIQHALREKGREKRFQLAGLTPGLVTMRVERRLNRIVNDAPLRDAYDLAVKAKLTDLEANQLTQELMEERSEEGQHDIIRRWRERDDLKLRMAERRRAPNAASSASQRTSSRLFAALGSAANLLAAHTTRASLGLTTDSEYKRAVTLSEKVWSGLDSMADSPTSTS